MTHPDKAMVERVARLRDYVETFADETDDAIVDRDQRFGPTMGDLRAILAALTAIPNPQGGPDAAFIWKWVERAMFDKTIGMKNAVETLAHYPGAPWNNGRWDVDHKEYAAAFYAIFPNAALPPPPVQETE